MSQGQNPPEQQTTNVVSSGNFGYNQFDVVELLRLDHATLLYNIYSAELPKANWSVTRVLGDWLVIYRAGLIVRIPITDVRLTARYSINAALEHLRSISGYGVQIKTPEKHLGSEEGDPDFAGEQHQPPSENTKSAPREHSETQQENGTGDYNVRQ